MTLVLGLAIAFGWVTIAVAGIGLMTELIGSVGPDALFRALNQHAFSRWLFH